MARRFYVMAKMTASGMMGGQVRENILKHIFQNNKRATLN